MAFTTASAATTGCGNKKRPHYKNCDIFETVQEFYTKIFGVIKDDFWHKRRKFNKVSLLYAKMVRVIVLNDVFLSERTTVYLLSVKIFFKNIF